MTAGQVSLTVFARKVSPGACTIKLFTAKICGFLWKAKVFVSGKPFYHSLMFTSKVRVYPSEAPFRCFNLGLAPGLTPKHLTRLEKLVRDKLADYENP
jgi:hypothetical protein